MNDIASFHMPSLSTDQLKQSVDLHSDVLTINPEDPISNSCMHAYFTLLQPRADLLHRGIWCCNMFDDLTKQRNWTFGGGQRLKGDWGTVSEVC